LALALALAEEQEEEVNEGIAAWKESEGERRRATTRRQRWTIKGAWELALLSPIFEQRRSRRRRSRRCCCFKLFVALSLSRSRRASPRCPSSLLLPSSHRSARDARERPRPWRVPFVFFSLLVVRARVCLVRAWHLAAALPPRVACSDTPPLARSGARRAPQWCEACGECVSE